MNVWHLLPAMLAAVDDESITVFVYAFVSGYFARNSQHAAQCGFVFCCDIVDGWNVLVRYYKYVGWQAWADISEGCDKIILVEHIGGQLFTDDLAENRFANALITGHNKSSIGGVI